MHRSPLSNISNTSKQKVPAFPKRKSGLRTGRWQKDERIAFLRGFRIYGKGNWVKIAQMIPNRTTVQVKTHAQHIVKLMEDGADPFKELEDYYATDAAAVSKKTKNGNTPSELRAAQLLVALKYNM